jgi:mercuric reductase
MNWTEVYMPSQSVYEQNAVADESIRLVRALRHLNRLLPLKYRQAGLAPPLAGVHRAILRSFAERGRPLTRAEIGDLLGGESVALEALTELGSKDLVVLNSAAVKDPDTSKVMILDPAAVEIVGAYPFSVPPTAYVVSLFGHDVFAMCALDALSIAAMFNTETRISSKCHATGEPVRIRQHGMEILEVSPATTQFGVRWHKGSNTAAHGL